MEKYLPIGTVVMLKGGSKSVMIYGRRQSRVGEKVEHDYLACLFPEGNINENFMYLFNHEDIAEVLHYGLNNDEEKQYNKNLIKMVSDFKEGE